MAPEQAKGRVVDKRVDVWAFGAVVYEMLMGTRAFIGDDVSDTLAAVLRAEVDLEGLPEETPRRLRQVLRACLQRDPKQRVHDVADVRLAIEGAFESTASTPSEKVVTPQLQVWQRPVPAAAAVLAALVVGGLAVWSLTAAGPPAAHRPARFVVNTPPDGPLQVSLFGPEVAISPDGTRIVYGSGTGSASSGQLYLRRLDQLETTPLRGTEGGSFPVFSPDGASVAFYDILGNILKRVSVLGGPAVTISENDGILTGMSLGPDDTIVFATETSRGLLRIPAVGGEPEVLTTVDPESEETDHRWPEVLPNGNAVVFTAWSGSTESSRIAVLSLETGEVS